MQRSGPNSGMSNSRPLWCQRAARMQRSRRGTDGFEMQECSGGLATAGKVAQPQGPPSKYMSQCRCSGYVPALPAPARCLPRSLLAAQFSFYFCVCPLCFPPSPKHCGGEAPRHCTRNAGGHTSPAVLQRDEKHDARPNGAAPLRESHHTVHHECRRPYIPAVLQVGIRRPAYQQAPVEASSMMYWETAGGAGRA